MIITCCRLRPTSTYFEELGRGPYTPLQLSTIQPYMVCLLCTIIYRLCTWRRQAHPVTMHVVSWTHFYCLQLCNPPTCSTQLFLLDGPTNHSHSRTSSLWVSIRRSLLWHRMLFVWYTNDPDTSTVQHVGYLPMAIWLCVCRHTTYIQHMRCVCTVCIIV